MKVSICFSVWKMDPSISATSRPHAVRAKPRAPSPKPPISQERLVSPSSTIKNIFGHRRQPQRSPSATQTASSRRPNIAAKASCKVIAEEAFNVIPAVIVSNDLETSSKGRSARRTRSIRGPNFKQPSTGKASKTIVSSGKTVAATATAGFSFANGASTYARPAASSAREMATAFLYGGVPAMFRTIELAEFTDLSRYFFSFQQRLEWIELVISERQIESDRDDGFRDDRRPSHSKIRIVWDQN